MTFPSELLTGYVLAGGASSRMGQDKALLEVDGEALAARCFRTLQDVCSTVAILRGPHPDPGRTEALEKISRTIPDAEPGLGPVGGIAAALADAATPWVLIVAVDQPFLPAELLGDWFVAAYASGASASWMEVAGALQPVPMLLGSRLADAFQRCVRQGERKVRLAVEQALHHGGMAPAHRYTLENSSRTVSWFRNLNHPEDLLPDPLVGSSTSGSWNQSMPRASEQQT